MKANRRWFFAAAILLVAPLLFASYSRGDRDGEETKFRWDIIHFTSFNPPTVEAGGHTGALAEDMSKITLTGSGTFVVGDSER